MDPCRFLRVVIANLAIRFPNSDPSPESCFCKIKLSDFPSQSAQIPILPTDLPHPDSHSLSGSACFTLTRPDVQRLVAEMSSKKLSKRPAIKIDVYSKKSSGFGSSGKLLGRVVVPVELTQIAAEGKACMILHNGWVEVVKGRVNNNKPEVYLTVKVDPDPRFVFEFGSAPECSPQVFQVQGSIKQPVFSCKFSHHRSSGDSTMSEKDQARDQRKGWSITIHDLSGSPVAAASMVTPFVPSPGSDRVSRSNPGGWLILRPGDSTWKPWGRLEAWEDQPNRVGYRFDLSHDIADGLTLAQSTFPTRPGGKFTIDVTDGVPSPAVSPNSSLDFGSGSGSSSGRSAGGGRG